jgi:hypothetical protein
VLEPVLLRSRSDESKELEIVVLRHQLDVLGRQLSRAQPKGGDRVSLAAASRLLGRGCWRSFFVTRRAGVFVAQAAESVSSFDRVVDPTR